MRHSASYTDFLLTLTEYFTDNGPVHRHNYFELIYVLEGSGVHVINDNRFDYEKGDLFLLTPADHHTLLSDSRSQLCMIDFTAAFFGRTSRSGQEKPELSHFFRQLEYIFRNAPHVHGSVRMNEEDRAFCRMLIQRLITEWNTQEVFRNIVLQNLVFLLLNIIARYATVELPVSVPEKKPNGVYAMIDYIQQHIYENDRISIESIAAHFHLSPDYTGAYFRKHSGKTIKQFILDYKLGLIKTRLHYSQLTMAQIATELGFTDESHLNKLFRKKYGMTARQYSRQAQSRAEADHEMVV